MSAMTNVEKCLEAPQRTAQHIMRFTKVDNDDTSVAKMIFHVVSSLTDVSRFLVLKGKF